MKNRSLCLFSVFILVAAAICAQDRPEGQGEMMPGLRRQAVILDIDAQVLAQQEQNQVVVWNETTHKVVMPGSPVGLRLVGSNVVVVMQFTPFIPRRGQNMLVAQGQVWLEVPNEGIRYYTSIQTIPLEFDQPIYYFPLGESNGDSSIKITLTVKPNDETAHREGTTVNSGNGN
jgi:hypothetical protein